MEGIGLMARDQLRSSEFRREREVEWRELDSLVKRIERVGMSSLSPDDLIRLPVLHRAAMSSLSVARSVTLDRNLLQFLETLTARSFFCVYSVKKNALDTVKDFFGRRFPIAVVALRWKVLVAAFLLASGVLTGHVLTLENFDRYYSFVPEGMASGRNPGSSTAALKAVLYDSNGGFSDALATFSAFLFSNNTRVGLLCFGLGFAAGVPVFGLLFWNGIILGSMSALYQSRGLGSEFWAWVMPHGVTELGAIVLCGAAGLLLGQSVLFPGRRTRLTQLAHDGKQAGVVVLGTVSMFLAAAFIEGFFRQLVHNEMIRWGVAALTTVLWLLYFTVLGRRESE